VPPWSRYSLPVPSFSPLSHLPTILDKIFDKAAGTLNLLNCKSSASHFKDTDQLTARGLRETMAEIMENITNLVIDHPYYPIQVEIAGLIANEYSVTVLLGLFTAICASIVFGTTYVVNWKHPNLPGSEKAAIWWFVICK
jgi:hypothetical protein